MLGKSKMEDLTEITEMQEMKKGVLETGVFFIGVALSCYLSNYLEIGFIGAMSAVRMIENPGILESIKYYLN